MGTIINSLDNLDFTIFCTCALTDISQNLSNLFFYCYKCLIHSNSDAKVQNILETKEDFEKKQKKHEIIMKRFAFHVSKCENYCSNNYIIIIYINI